MTFADIVNTIIVPFVDTSVIPLLYALAFIFFLMGMVRLFFAGEYNVFTGKTTDINETRTKGRVFALWGIIGLVVIFTFWSVVKLLFGFLSTGQL